MKLFKIIVSSLPNPLMVFVSAQSLSHVRLFVTPSDCSPQGPSIHGISQSRILEWVAISFSRGFS